MMSLDIRRIMVAAPSAAYYKHINTRWWLLLCPTVASFEKNSTASNKLWNQDMSPSQVS
jgi:hypothetical protein